MEVNFYIVLVFLITNIRLSKTWYGHEYWNSRYGDYGISYTPDDTANGLWSETVEYITDLPTQRCAGCDCAELHSNSILQNCDGSVEIVSYSFQELNNETFAPSTSSIFFHACPPFSIAKDTFNHVTSLTSLTIKDCAITMMPYVDYSPLIILNLIENKLNIDSTYNGKLPASLEYLALTRNQFHWFPDEFIKGDNLRLVSLGYNNITTFPLSAFGSLPKLMYLGMEGNSLQKISKRHLQLFVTADDSPFVHLNLSSNQIDYVQPGALRQLTNLKIVELHSNSIAHLPRGTFENLTELLHLDLHGNHIEVLNSEALIDLENLMELRLHTQNPKMTTLMFNSMINVGKSLRYLFVSDNALSHLPHQVFTENNFPKLIELYADHNGIKNITGLDERGYGVKLRHIYKQKLRTFVPFANTSSIIKMDLSRNPIEQINDTELCALTKLEVLYLETTRLHEYNIQEDAFKCVPTLEELNLGGSYLMEHVPKALTTKERLSAIRILWLHYSSITFIETNTFNNLSTLTTLNMWGCKLLAIEDNAFPRQLQALRLHNNRFRFIHEYQFSYLEKLTTLELQNNQIDFLPYNAFVNCTSLTDLNLDYNKIPQLKKVHFCNCPLTGSVSFANNHIGWIEDGTFSHISSMVSLSFASNRLYWLPNGGDFNNLNIGKTISFVDNRISSIPSGAFVNFTALQLSLANNRISSIGSNAFKTSTISHTLSLSNNQLRKIDSYAFSDLTVGDIVLSGMSIGTLPSFAFYKFNANEVLMSNSQILSIQKSAFYDVTVIGTKGRLNLNTNQLTSLSTSIFGGTSSISKLYLDNNQLTHIAINAFRNVSVTDLYLQNNNLTTYPKALKDATPEHVYLHNNIITKIPKGSLNGQTQLKSLVIYNNKLTEIADDLFTTVTHIVSIDMHNNIIQKIHDGSFTGLDKLKKIDLSNNLVPYFPAINLPSLETLNLQNNKIESLGTIQSSEKLSTINFSDNPLGCNCGTIESLMGIKNALSSDTKCSSPTGVTGVFLSPTKESDPLYYQNIDKKRFQCTAQSLKSHGVTSTRMTIKWDRPKFMFELFGDNSTSTTIAASGATYEVWDYLISCTSTTASTLEKIVRVTAQLPRYCYATYYNGPTCVDECLYIDTSSKTIQCSNPCTPTPIDKTPISTTDCGADCLDSNGLVNNAGCTRSCIRSTADMSNCNTASYYEAEVTFTSSDGLLSLTSYECTIKTRIDGYTSASSLPLFISTPSITSSPGNPSIGSTDVVVDIVYYDFSAGNDDFSTTTGLLPRSPYHVVSPLGSWLAFSDDPTSDTVSDWFRSSTSNHVKNDELVLKHDTDVTSATVHMFWSDKFYPLDNFGYESEGQIDCSGGLHNFAFTSTIRTGIKYSGTEKITIGGGDEFWLFIDKQLIVELIADRTSGQIACQVIDLSIAKDNGMFAKFEGDVIDGECTNMHPKPSSAFKLPMKIGETYLFEIFHAERQGCSSELLIRLENVYLSIHDGDDPPFHYKFYVNENVHTNAIVGEFPAWDVYHTGPSYQVELTTGNEARHFILKEDTNANRNLANTPEQPTYTYREIYGLNVSYVECLIDSVPMVESSIPGAELFTLSTLNALVTLSTELDYEVMQDYILHLNIKDLGSNKEGSLVLKVSVTDYNDNCPQLNVTGDVFITPQPLLQLPPLMSVTASDVDSGVNAEYTYYVSHVHTESPEIDYSESLDIRREVYNSTTELTVTLAVIDNGTPPLGSAINVTVNISNTCLLNEHLDKTNYTFLVNETTGDLYLRIPGYWIVNFQCSDDIGLASGIVRDELITASSFRSFLTKPERGRLNITASTPEFGPLSGGWIAAESDTNPYIQVDLEAPYKVTKVQTQGQEDEPNWIEAFQILYSDYGHDWNVYHDSTGEYIFLGNNDQNSVKILALNPPIFGRYIRINPRNWTGSAALRMELSGCSQAEQYHYDTSCERCYTSFYCLGDGLARTCGRCENTSLNCTRSLTEHSFGAASECSACPKGWICKEGYATPCPNFQYTECNNSLCPESCVPCEPGYACRGGQRYQCQSGTYSVETEEFCQLCKEGTYQDLNGQTSCKPCPAGYHSSTAKDRCTPCEAGTYSNGDSSGICVGCFSGVECPCEKENICFSKDLCVNTGRGGFQCLGCPVGYTGDGVTCTDINECDLYKPCWNNSACLNTVPGYQCLACPRGYHKGTYEDGLSSNDTVRIFEYKNEALSPVQDQMCYDIDECTTNNGGCDINAPCVNTMGSFYCGYCAEGYTGIPDVVCYSTNYCQTGQNKCAEVATCTYIGPKEYRCECPIGYAGNGYHCGKDTDLDGHPNVSLPCSDWGCKRDNCISIPNSGQEDADGDNSGDDCDDDKDNDGKINSIDNCPFTKSFDQTDTDGDGIGNPCDNCVGTSNPDQTDTDSDGTGDVCDTDSDNDGITDTSDNCPVTRNPSQDDRDGDGYGDACDNCPNQSNSDQIDTDQNGIGDACTSNSSGNLDRDGDGILDSVDNCIDVANGEQSDIDKDGLGDSCDTDIDADSVDNTKDNCPYLSNPLQKDFNGDQVGDDCVVDSDGDGVDDINDTCPHNPSVSTTSFIDHMIIDLYPGVDLENTPQWWIKGAGREIYQLAATKGPSMLIGRQSYASVSYSGTIYARSDTEDNYVGIVFGYQSTLRFYIVSWKTKNENLFRRTYKAAIRGIQIKVVDSKSGPGANLAQALWDSSSTENETIVIWQDRNTTHWSNNTSYKWLLTHHSDIGKIRFQLYDLDRLLVDSGDVYNTRITGGRVGVYQFGQQMALFSDIWVHCLDRANKALKLDGGTYVMITEITKLSINKSFSIDVWISMENGSPITKMPLVCTESHLMCLWLESFHVHVQYGNATTSSNTTISQNKWSHIMMQYDESEYSLKLYINGVVSGTVASVEPLDLTYYTDTSDVELYLGTDKQSFFEGMIDEMKFYNVAVLENDVKNHISMQSLDKYPFYHGYGQLHFKMNHEIGSKFINSEGLISLSSEIHGNSTFVESTQDFARFHMDYPNN